MRYNVSEEADLTSLVSASAERQLWCAVLDRALHDAVDRITDVPGPKARDTVRDEARQWFVLNGMEFQVACDSAGYDPDYLRSRILPMIGGTGGQRTAADPTTTSTKSELTHG